MYIVCGITDTGCVREHNEDHIFVCGKIVNDGSIELSTEADEILLAVSDGMGGLEAGEIASKMTLDMLPMLDTYPNSEQFIKEINKKVYEYSISRKSVMGCTLSGMTVKEKLISIFHVGDSRIYRFRNGYLKQLTHDHSLVQTLFEAADISEEERDSHEMKHIILQAIGIKEDIAPEIQNVAADENDIFLLCSDGLSTELTIDEMEMILSDDCSIALKAKKLVEKAKVNGGHDNISVILAMETNQSEKEGKT